jgi:hypothetical protein
MRILPLSLLLLCASLGAETGYRYVHPDGTVEFSDQPIPGGEEIKLREAPTIHLAPPPSSQTPTTSSKGGSPTGESKSSSGNSTITISSPQPEQTLWYDEAGVNVSVTITPELQSGEKVVITLDGSVVASGSGSSFNIGEVYRGSHSLSASIVSSSGALLSSSSPVTFYMRHYSAIDRRQPADEQDPSNISR